MNSAFNWMLPGGGEGLGADDDAREAIEKNEAHLKEALRLQKEFARLFLDVFTTGRGPECLEALRQNTVDIDLMSVSPTIAAGLREVSLSAAEWAYHRNGQNSVVRWIEQLIALAQKSENEEPNDV
ncbi:MAG TPA: hypothetical protein VJM50_17545 [Pyrinomonadaceae bacterium]|nr:hypothetical protein [Pyrinomonadaceae bacterium]